MSEMGGVIWRWSKVGCVHARPLQCIHAAMGPTNSSNRRHFHGRSARPVPSRFRADREGSAGQGWYCDVAGMAVRWNRNRTASEPKRRCDGSPVPPPPPPFTQESNLCSESTENDPLLKFGEINLSFFARRSTSFTPTPYYSYIHNLQPAVNH